MPHQWRVLATPIPAAWVPSCVTSYGFCLHVAHARHGAWQWPCGAESATTHSMTFYAGRAWKAIALALAQITRPPALI